MNKSVLILEDDPAAAEDIASILLRNGFEVHDITIKGIKRTEKAEHLTPGIALIDIQFTGEIYGVETVLAFINSGIPVVFLTTHSSELLLKRSMEMQPYGYLIKPVDEWGLMTTINLSIKRSNLEKNLRNKEAELSESMEKYSSIVNSASDTIWITDITGNFTFVNPALTRVIKYDQNELLGKNIFSFIDSSQQKYYIKAHTDQLKKGIKELYTEVRIVPKTGEKIWLGQHVQLISKNGNFTGFQAIGSDITETKNKEREMEIARTVNDAIMRKNAESDRIATLYFPMRAIGGDIIDIIRFNDPDTIGILIGDVSGHGVPAALIATMIKGVISKAGESRYDPVEFLSYLNDGIYGYNGGYFITAFYGIFRLSTGCLTFSSAGHNPPVLISPEGVSNINSINGIPLGIMSTEDLAEFNKKYTRMELTIHSDEKILLYTDGLSESCAKNNNLSMFEDIELKESLSRNRILNGKDFIDAIFSDLVAFHGNDSFEDDISIICLDGPHK